MKSWYQCFPGHYNRQAILSGNVCLHIPSFKAKKLPYVLVYGMGVTVMYVIQTANIQYCYDMSEGSVARKSGPFPYRSHTTMQVRLRYGQITVLREMGSPAVTNS